MKSFLQGKKVLNQVALRAPHGLTGSTPAMEAAHSAAHASHAPHIDIVKQGDKIMRIVVTCTCGERTEIECLYSPGQ